MSHPIITTGTNPGPISTDKLSTETRSQWVARHEGYVLAAAPTGDVLTTIWYSAACGAMERVTTRKANETDANFLKRHVEEFDEDMGGCPPLA